MDGDAKICFKEFENGMRSTLTVFASSRRYQKGHSRQPSHETLTPRNASKVARPGTADRKADQRRRETELRQSGSK
jgi:hypothetical protein